MEWLVGDPRRKVGSSGFFALIASMLIGVFASSLLAVTPVLAQGADDDQPATQQEEAAPTDESSSSPLTAEAGECNVASMGWWICGPAMWVAGGMDTMYNYLNEFMKVRPLEVSNQSSGFYKAWDIMRTIANSVFIVALLIIIYSQITSFGISNYGIKKMASRLIVAAMLVNLSYTICAVAIDLSNIAGVTVKDLFTNITQQVAAGEANRESIGAADITQSFLAGGALVVAGGLALEGSTLAATPFFIPILAMLFLSLLVALLVMAARQALIIILTIISPIAFVLYLLPGTEKWFDKWKDTFLVMMIFFPAFAVIFGGSELAGILIMSNPTTLVMYILGFAVMFIPLAITPFILKLSGGILNRFAGIINDPTKGLVDKSKQWAQNKSKVMAGNSRARMEKREAARDSRPGRNGKPRGRKWYDSLKPLGGARRMARYADTSSRLLKDQVSDTEKALENSYHQADRYKRQDLKTRHTNDRGELISQQASNRYDEMKAGSTPSREDVAPRFRDRVNVAASHITRGRIPEKDSWQGQTSEIRTTFENVAAEGMRKNNNQRALNVETAQAMLTNAKLREKAAGIYEFGEDAAMASAITAMRSDYGKAVEEGAEIVKHFNLSSEQRQDHAMGRREFVVEKDGASYKFDKKSVFTRENAVSEQVKNGTVPEVVEIVANSGGSLKQFATTIATDLQTSNVKSKAPMLGGKLVDEVGKGVIGSNADLQNYTVEWLQAGKFNASALSSADKDGLNLIINALGPEGSPARAAVGEKRLKGLSAKIDQVFAVPELRANMADNADEVFAALRSTLPDPDPFKRSGGVK